MPLRFSTWRFHGPDIQFSLFVIRLDKKIEIPLPNEQGRIEVLKIHASGINKNGEIDYEQISKLAEGFNAADMRNVCTEAGMFAIRDERDYVVQASFLR